jgi:prophage antirepressor-like protein
MKNNLQIFNFKEKQVRTAEIDNEIYFIATDVCEVLEISNTSDAIGRLDEDEKLISTLPISGQNREVLLISESGLYSLVLTSRKPEAKIFKSWITRDVIPSIRKTGSYSVKPNVREALDLSESAIRAAKAFGLVDEQAKFAANRLIHGETGINMLNKLGIELVIESGKTTFTPTQIAERMGLKSAREVNIILQNLGYQKQVGGDSRWEPTEKGKPFSKMKGVDLEAKKSVKAQLVWYETIFEQLDIRVLSKLD